MNRVRVSPGGGWLSLEQIKKSCEQGKMDISCEQGEIKIPCEQGEIFDCGWLSLAQADIRISRQPGEIRISLLVGWGFSW